MRRRLFLLSALVVLPTAAASHPSLIPYPQKIEWTGLTLECARYSVQAPPEGRFAAAELERILMAAGAQPGAGGAKIIFRVARVEVPNPVGASEAYSLGVTTRAVVITAPKANGLLYGVETLRQLVVR
jgi:hypothetical protein